MTPRLDGGAITAGVHHFRVRVFYEDTDAAGVVYHANYLRFAERGRTEMLRCLGLDHHALRTRFDLVFAVRRCAVDFIAPAILDDDLEIRTGLARLGGASLDLEQQIFRDERRLTRLEVRLAMISSQMRPKRLPVSLLDAMAPMLKGLAQDQ
ncbi:MAG: tol-pal system-associated acyl-CoA thioesterase [Pseudomonadota bacterium]